MNLTGIDSSLLFRSLLKQDGGSLSCLFLPASQDCGVSAGDNFVWSLSWYKCSIYGGVKSAECNIYDGVKFSRNVTLMMESN